MASKPETLFRKRVDKDLAKVPHSFWMSIQQKTIRGDPDKLGCVNGHFVALELKSADGEATKLQEYKLARVRTAGGYSFLADPYNWLRILRDIKQLAQGEKHG